MGCSNYPQCKYTERVTLNNEKISKDEIQEKPCPVCGKPLIKRYSPKTAAILHRLFRLSRLQAYREQRRKNWAPARSAASP